MKKLWPWLIGFSVFLFIGVIVFWGIGFLRTQRMPIYWHEESDQLFREDFWHSPGMGMRSGYRVFGLPFLGIFISLFLIAIPFGLLALIVFGIIFLVRERQKPNQNLVENTAIRCDNCGKLTEPGWQVCPYCGETLRKV